MRPRLISITGERFIESHITQPPVLTHEEAFVLKPTEEEMDQAKKLLGDQLGEVEREVSLKLFTRQGISVGTSVSVRLTCGQSIDNIRDADNLALAIGTERLVESTTMLEEMAMDLKNRSQL